MLNFPFIELKVPAISQFLLRRGEIKKPVEDPMKPAMQTSA